MIRSRLTLRQKIYMFVLIAGWLYILAPCVVHADIFGSDVPDIYVDITNEVRETNELLNKAYEFATTNPYDIIKEFCKQKVTMSNIHFRANQVALAVATLLLMVDFFKKSITFEWSSKWENILLFLIKIIVVKQIVQNADVILTYVYRIFDYVNDAVTGISPNFLPCEKVITYKFLTTGEQLQAASRAWWELWSGTTVNIPVSHHEYIISEEAVKIFYPDAELPAADSNSVQWGEYDFKNPTGKAFFNATIEKVFLFPYFLIMKCLAYFIFVVVIGRLFELLVYTTLAPLPMCTFASEITQDTAKGFLKNYIACILQMAVIGTMFSAYRALCSYFVSGTGGNLAGVLKDIKMIHIILLFSLCVGIAKSGEWSRRLCGAS